MAAHQRGLGRGLDALLSGFQENPGTPEVVLVPITKISANVHQPRRTFEQDALQELASSIQENGVLQPVLIRPLHSAEQLYELVAGERRWRASQIAGLSELPAIIKPLSDEESLAIALIENLQREDLNPMEQALGLKRLQEEFDLTQEEIAHRMGKSRPAIANLLRLTQLPQAIQDDIRACRISAGHGRSLLSIGDPVAQQALRQRILDEALSVRECEALAAYFKRTGHLPEQANPRAAKKRSCEPLPVIKQLNSRLQESLSLKVKLSGDTEQGRLTVSYRDREEFLALMKRLGLDVSLEA